MDFSGPLADACFLVKTNLNLFVVLILHCNWHAEHEDIGVQVLYFPDREEILITSCIVDFQLHWRPVHTFSPAEDIKN